MIRADRITIKENEGRFMLLIEDSSWDGRHEFDIHDCVLEFYAEVQRELRPWYLEAEHARATIPRKITAQVEDVYDHVDAGYALDDPKHPRWHSTHADLWDAREGK